MQESVLWEHHWYRNAQDGSKEKVLIYTASKSYNSAKTRYSTPGQDILLCFPLCRRSDGSELEETFDQDRLSIENEDLRDFVAQLSEYSFSVEYVPGVSNIFRYWLSGD